MDGNQILLLGLGIEAPWKLVDQRLDTDKQPHELHLTIKAERGSKYACPVCGEACAAHDFQEKTWQHLNFFQHHCYVHASVPRVKCPDHGVKLVDVPWARKGSAFSLLFEQAALTLVREMPVNAAARIMEITDKRLWRVVQHYVAKAVASFDLSAVQAIGLDETASKRGHNYVTVFIDMVRIPLKMTADSEERDRLAHRFLTGAGFLLRAVTIGQLGGQFAHRFPAQFEAVRTVQQSVEDGVRQGRLADVVVPVLGG